MRLGTVEDLSGRTSWNPIEAGEQAIREVGRFIDNLPSELSGHARKLMQRHGYVVAPSGKGPHTNPLGHPLFDLVLWIDNATADRPIDPDTVRDICYSSLFGYLSVRADDDFFDGDWGNAQAAMMTSTVFRMRHQALLAAHVSDRTFWDRFETVWREYAEAMLREHELHEPSSAFEPVDFELILGKSQPLEIPPSAILAMKERWDLAPDVTRLVRHLTRSTQILDDFVDAPTDLASGNYTLMVRKLGGLEGEGELRRAMVARFDEVMAEVSQELDMAVALAEGIGVLGVTLWAEERKRLLAQAASTMFSTLFQQIGRT